MVDEDDSGSTRTDRGLSDLAAAEGIGMAATWVGPRGLAAGGAITQVPVLFGHHQHVEHAGVLFGLPALLSQGLLEASDKVYGAFSQGYYSLRNIMLLLAFMALCRIKNPEQLKKYAPGELGKILGLDRCPEVKCLRAKIEAIVSRHKASDYLQALSQQWIKEEGCVYFYADGHVRVYTGSKAQLSKKYVARQKLCLTGTQEFWINDQSGSPLTMCIGELNERLKDGIIRMVPSLLAATTPAVPPTAGQQDNPLLPRFTLVFDREVYQPAFFKTLWEEHRIAIITYRKFVKDLWPQSEFKYADYQYEGRVVRLNICEKEILLGNCLMREIRTLAADGDHQSAIITTNCIIPAVEVAHKMFSRWNQENFFRYMISDFDFDKMIQYGYEELDDNMMVINPDYSILTYQIKKLRERKRRIDAQFYQKVVQVAEQPIDVVQPIWKDQASLVKKQQELAVRIQEVMQLRSQIQSRITLKQMDPVRRYNKLPMESKYLMNIIKMIAYRAETALYNNLPGIYANAKKDGRMLIKEIFITPADIIPDENAHTLTVVLYPLSTPRANKAAKHLCQILNETETLYPGTDLKIIYKCVSA